MANWAAIDEPRVACDCSPCTSSMILHTHRHQRRYSKFDLTVPSVWRAEVICPASDREIQKHSEQTFEFVRETPEVSKEPVQSS
jgi:hypothetical protein